MSLAAFFVGTFIAIGLTLSAWDWYSCLKHTGRTISKLAPMYLAISATTAMMMHVGAQPTLSLVALGLWWYMAGLVASLVGDAFLLDNTFVPGLAAFLIAHIALAIAFWHHARLVAPNAIGLLVVLLTAVVVAIVPGSTFIRAVCARERVPVLAYLLVIGFMIVASVNTANPLLILGAVLFGTSDYLLARERYVPGSRVQSVHVMVTYHLAQWLFLLAFALFSGVFV